MYAYAYSRLLRACTTEASLSRKRGRPNMIGCRRSTVISIAPSVRIRTCNHVIIRLAPRQNKEAGEYRDYSLKLRSKGRKFQLVNRDAHTQSTPPHYRTPSFGFLGRLGIKQMPIGAGFLGANIRQQRVCNQVPRIPPGSRTTSATDQPPAAPTVRLTDLRD